MPTYIHIGTKLLAVVNAVDHSDGRIFHNRLE
jgi:hypothetical protein